MSLSPPAPHTEIGQCTALVWLSLHANRLASVPPELGLLTNMTRLSLHMLEVGVHGGWQGAWGWGFGAGGRRLGHAGMA